MRNQLLLVGLLAGASLFLTQAVLAAPAKSDIPSPLQRKPALDLAQRLAQPPPPIVIPADTKSIFRHPGFGSIDPEDQKAQAAVASGPAKPATDKDLLTLIAEKIIPSGTATLNGEPFLLIRQKKMKKGDHLAISFDGRDYDVEITDIQRTTFSLRLNQAEITRPIKSGSSKTPTP